MSEPAKAELHEFIGRMQEWKEGLTKSFDKVIDKLESVATKKEIENHEQQINGLRKQITVQWWLMIMMMLVSVFGELAVHRVEWLLAFFK